MCSYLSKLPHMEAFSPTHISFDMVMFPSPCFLFIGALAAVVPLHGQNQVLMVGYWVQADQGQQAQGKARMNLHCEIHKGWRRRGSLLSPIDTVGP